MITLTNEQYEGIACLLCPYCRAKLPDVRNHDRKMFEHGIPGTNHQFDCGANAIRGQFVVVQG